MDDIANVQSNDGMVKNAARIEEDVPRAGESSTARFGEDVEGARKRSRPWAKKRKSYSHVHYKVYKRRWFGLAQLVLLNVVVSWDVSVMFSFWEKLGWEDIWFDVCAMRVSTKDSATRKKARMRKREKTLNLKTA